jgi:hypothetical protein
MALSDAYEEKVLDHILGTTECTFDNTVFLGLGTDASPARATFTEVSTDAGYTRQAIVFAAASGTSAANDTGTLTFGPCSGTAWGTLKSFGLFTASSGGSRILQGALTDQTKVVGLGDSATVVGGAITVTTS